MQKEVSPPILFGAVLVAFGAVIGAFLFFSRVPPIPQGKVYTVMPPPGSRASNAKYGLAADSGGRGSAATAPKTESRTADM